MLTGDFYWVLLGTLLITVAAPIFLASQTLICNKWFPAEELGLENALSGLMIPLGCIIAFIWSGLDF
jgi:hypothetical protein